MAAWVLLAYYTLYTFGVLIPTSHSDIQVMTTTFHVTFSSFIDSLDSVKIKRLIYQNVNILLES